MDREKQKRNQLIRVVLTEILMVLAIIPIVVLLTFLAMGYHLGDDLSLEQSGLVQINSLPSGATVRIDGEDKFRTDSSKMLAQGEHKIEIFKNGYDTWSKTIDVVPGILLRVRYPRLFKQERETEEVETVANDNLKLISAAPNRTQVLLHDSNNGELKVLNIKGDDAKMSKLELSGILQIDENGGFAGTIDQIKWSWGGDAVLMKIKYSDRIEWVLADMRDALQSRNLTKDFGLAVSDAQFAGDSIDRVYILENSNLREINLGNSGISRVLLTGVEEFYAEKEYVGYIGKLEDVRMAGIYHNGDTGGVKVTEVPDGLSARIAISEYYGEKYISLAMGEKLMIYEGENWPVHSGDLSRMRLVVDAEVGVVAQSQLVVNRTGEVIILHNGQTLIAVDLETKKYDKYEALVGAVQFIDDYLLYGVEDDKLYVWDFDGDNKRQLANNVKANFAVISANNRWLYYVSKRSSDGQLILVRERIV